MGEVVFGRIAVDRVTFTEAIDAIEGLVAARRGGAVFTPNVDHVVLAETDDAFCEAYRAASLRLADGMPLVWASRLLGLPLPEKVSGSDLVWPLMQRAAVRGWRVYLCGGGPGVAEAAAQHLEYALGVTLCGVDAPWVSDPADPRAFEPIARRIVAAKADLALFAFGAPKQELLIHRCRAELGSTVALGIGAALDFIAGTVRRAPRWMSRCGLEWLYRLSREPRRLWRRYLLRDPKFLAIALRSWWRRPPLRVGRIVERPAHSSERARGSLRANG